MYFSLKYHFPLKGLSLASIMEESEFKSDLPPGLHVIPDDPSMDFSEHPTRTTISSLSAESTPVGASPCVAKSASQLKCATCSNPFHVDPAFYDAKGWSLPKACPDCRRAVRETEPLSLLSASPAPPIFSSAVVISSSFATKGTRDPSGASGAVCLLLGLIPLGQEVVELASLSRPRRHSEG